MSPSSSSAWDIDSHIIPDCPLCHAPGECLEIHLLGESGDSSLLHVLCNECEHALLALVFDNGEGSGGSVGFMTDLSHKEVIRFRRQSSVSVDDVLSLHIALKSGVLVEELQKEVSSRSEE